MQHFPSITDAEFQEACQKFYDRANQAPAAHERVLVTYDHEVLSIKKEYLPHALKLEPFPNAQTEDQEELTDDEDPEVKIMDHSCSAFVCDTDSSCEDDPQGL